jgi:hypothetical protein
VLRVRSEKERVEFSTSFSGAEDMHSPYLFSCYILFLAILPRHERFLSLGKEKSGGSLLPPGSLSRCSRASSLRSLEETEDKTQKEKEEEQTSFIKSFDGKRRSHHWYPFSNWISAARARRKEGPPRSSAFAHRPSSSRHGAATRLASTTLTAQDHNLDIHSAERESLLMTTQKPLLAETHAKDSASAAASSHQPPSVHMQLRSATGPDDDDHDNSIHSSSSGTTTITIHSYMDTSTRQTYKALNTPKSKFQSYLQYQQVVPNGKEVPLETCQLIVASPSSSSSSPSQSNPNHSSSPPPPYRLCPEKDEDAIREEWRSLWYDRRLITDRTELLAVYPSDQSEEKISVEQQQDVAVRRRRLRRRGGFTDVLHLYASRLLEIWRDEQAETVKDNAGEETGSLVAWLREHYGELGTGALRAENMSQLPEAEQLATLKRFLEWFRNEFPYYYDRCGACGASIKEESAARQQQQHQEKEDVPKMGLEEEDDGDEEEDSEHPTFVGYIYPDADELRGKASRTELFRCHSCREFTRFPRFNSATAVLEHRRGRCGEYSMLLFRFLRALGHECRWVVDWSDHVWTEISLTAVGQHQRWVHLDPCEAAVDQNLLYQEWGKKQTYILGFYLPPTSQQTTTGSIANGALQSRSVFPMIEDITQTYTSDTWEDICKRRDESQDQVKLSIEKATQDLHDKVQLQEDNNKEH